MRHTIETALAALRAAEWMPITAVRILTGIFFCISGGTKLTVPAQFKVMERTISESHIPFPHANAIFVSLVEFVCGAGLALGLLTPLCAIMLAGVLIVAVTTNRVHSIQARGVLAWLDDFLYLPEVLYIMILVWLIFSGPGRYSIDDLITQNQVTGVVLPLVVNEESNCVERGRRDGGGNSCSVGFSAATVDAFRGGNRGYENRKSS